MPAYKERIDRFNAKWRESETGCHIWTASSSDGRYGSFWTGEKNGPAHRWIYEFHNGPIEPGHEIDHLCGATKCVNPEHLESVLPAVNKRRYYGGIQDVGHCRHGHPMGPGNVIPIRSRRQNVQLRCKECHRISNAKYRAAHT